MRRFIFSSAIAALALTSAVSVSNSTELLVPTAHLQITTAISNASNGDTITVTDKTSYDPFVVSKNLLIRNLNDSTVTITATAGNAAVEFTSSSPSTVDGGTYGFKFVGSSGASSVVKLGRSILTNCTVEDNGNAYTTDSAVRINTAGKLRNCAVNLSSTSSALAVKIETVSGAEVSNCTITSAKDGSGGDYEMIAITSSDAMILSNTLSFTNASTVGEAIGCSGNTPTFEDNLIVGAKYGIEFVVNGASVIENIMDLRANGWGLNTGSSGGHTIENNTIYLSSCSTGAVGLWFGGSPGTSYVNNNLFYNVLYGIFYNSGTTDNLSHNVFWGACGDSSNRSLSASQISKLEPLFCDGLEGTESFTQRIDSHAAPGNNGWGELVGARGIECAWGTLARNTTVPKSQTVKVLGDVTVNSGKSLTVAHDVSFLVDDDDYTSG